MKTLKDFSIYTKKVLSVNEYHSIILNANNLGFGNGLIVENSGFALSNTIKQKYKGKNICFICGKGFLGAVGLSTARHLINYVNLSVIILSDYKEIRNKETLFNYNILNDLIEIKSINENNISELNPYLKNNEIIVDAIISTGLKGRLSKFILKIVNMINNSNKKIISIDVPTGIDPDTGTTNIDCINANSVLCLYKLKQGLVKTKAIKNFITLIDNKIPISAELLTGNGDVVLATEPRNININKYLNGSVLIIGGSEKYHGAPVLAASAAKNAFATLRTGSGYVTVLVPKSIENIIKAVSPDLIVNSLEFKKIDESLKFISDIRHTSLVIGPGISNEISADFLSKLIESETKKENISIIDGSAIKLIKTNNKILNQKIILTPHEGEFFELTGINLNKAALEKKIEIAIEFAKTHKCTLVLKGNKTIITNGFQLKINKALTPTLAVMGSGDVLSGIIGSYSALHKNAFECAVAGVYIHSKISDKLFLEKGLHIIPDDIINALPNELKKYDIVN
ncbi:MAG: NAD(P)H-hydrate dehydratase [Candidatus Marsarchaeota archaeon]|nr:NAD(P)H-hydrate dehydratase [Candidatus Marsarchaeota archaeon]MCL5094560.1 NAD(P)H-hydrate dehydratase [Candidatus Marsarchaeota archaeon]